MASGAAHPMGEHTPVEKAVGQFCWWSLRTTDGERASRFYRDLFGWTAGSMTFPDGSTTTIYQAGRGGFAHPVPLEASFPGPSHWISSITVKDVDQACRRVVALGGAVRVPPFDIPTIGRTALITDPAGAAFHVFAPFREEEEISMIGNGPGEICWMELMLDEPGRVHPFYGESVRLDVLRTDGHQRWCTPKFQRRWRQPGRDLPATRRCAPQAGGLDGVFLRGIGGQDDREGENAGGLRAGREDSHPPHGLLRLHR